jgi:hypothetical protein
MGPDTNTKRQPALVKNIKSCSPPRDPEMIERILRIRSCPAPEDRFGARQSRERVIDLRCSIGAMALISAREN